MRRTTGSLLLFVLSVTLAYAVQPVSKPQEAYAPYWTSEPGWITELQLKNNLSSAPLTVTPVLRLASGREIVFDPSTIPPNSSVSVWVNQGLLNHAPDLFGQPGSYGSVVFRYTSPSAGNLYATVLLSIDGEPISFPMLARSESETAAQAASLEGIWWQASGTVNDVLVIGNHSDTKVSGTLALFDASGKGWTQTLVLGPHQSERMATIDLVKKAGLTGSYGGISFVTESPISAIDAAHFVYDEVSKFSASEELTRRDPNATLLRGGGPDAKHWTMYAPMLALSSPDPALGLPRGNVLQPTLFIRNTTAKNINADLSLTWRGDSATGEAKLPHLHLAPFATQQMQIGTMQPLLRIPDDAHWGLVTLTTDALPDDLVAIATSTDSSGRYNLPTRFAGGIGGHFTGGEWRIDANRNEIAAVTNIGSKATKALLRLHYDNGQKSYELEQPIASGDQMWVNLAQLTRQRVPDRKGNTLPVDLNSVTYDLQDLTPGGHGLMVNAVALDSSFGFQAVPPILRCCGYDSPDWSPDAFDLVLDGTEFGSIQGVDGCTSLSTNLSSYFHNWWSGNSAVAAVTTEQVQGVGVGATNGYASGYVEIGNSGYCTLQNVQVSAPVTVVPPPQIVSITPNTGQAGGSSLVAISGTGFGANPTVNVSPAGIQVVGASVNQDGTLINVTFTIPATIAAGSYSVTVSISTTDSGTTTSNAKPFTVTACASITGFQRKTWTPIPSTGELDITYTWSSSTGNLSDLAACQQSEYVTYPGSSGTYTWPRPPFGQTSANPTSVGGTASNGSFMDKHLPPGSWVKPYIAASFTANQTYQYVCPCVNSGNQNTLAQYTITRSVTQNSDGSFKYTVTKSSGESATLNPLP